MQASELMILSVTGFNLRTSTKVRITGETHHLTLPQILGDLDHPGAKPSYH